MKMLPLTKERVAFVDDCDYDYLNSYKWCSHCLGYAKRNRKKSDSPGPGTILMHRVVLELMGFVDFPQADHIDGDKLNNTRDNLRVVTNRQNNMNRGILRNNTSGFSGVSFYKNLGKWRAKIKINGKCTHLGYFANKQDAIAARKQATESVFGEFAHPSLIQEERPTIQLQLC